MEGNLGNSCLKGKNERKSELLFLKNEHDRNPSTVFSRNTDKHAVGCRENNENTLRN